MFRVTAFLIALCLFSCGQSERDNGSDSMKKDKIVIYQLITRLFGNTMTTNKAYGTLEENGVGKFNDINDTALTELKSLGISHVWYTGVIEHAVLTDYTAYGIPLDDADVVKGRAGSPYAIKDYYDVNPDLADSVPNRLQEFQELIERTHRNKLKVLIDFVPNHVARAYGSDQKPDSVSDFGTDDDNTLRFSPNNNFYYLPGESFRVPPGYRSLGYNTFPTKDGKFDETPAKATGNDQFTATPTVNDWFETVKLNYGVDYEQDGQEYFDPVPDTWNKMYDILAYWTAMGVDGFRCDMAQMVPVAFWNWIIPKVKELNPEILFIAEIYEAGRYRDYIFDGKFDYLYDKVELYDTLRNIIQGSMNTDQLTDIWKRQEGISDYMLRFLENHDEQRIASPQFAGDARKAIPAMVISTTMHSGPVMIYFGQEVGEPGVGLAGFSGDDGRTTHFDYWGVPEHQKWMNEGKFDGGQLSNDQKFLRRFYTDILHFGQEPAITNGEFYDLHYFNRSSEYSGYSDQVFAYLRHAENQNFLIVVNFSNQEQSCAVKIPGDALDKMQIGNEVIGSFWMSNSPNVRVSRQDLVNREHDLGIMLAIPPYGYEIIELAGVDDQEG